VENREAIGECLATTGAGTDHEIAAGGYGQWEAFGLDEGGADVSEAGEGFAESDVEAYGFAEGGECVGGVED